jgi:hypothetical protein
VVILLTVHAAIRAFRIFLDIVLVGLGIGRLLGNELGRRAVGRAGLLGMTAGGDESGARGERELEQIAAIHGAAPFEDVNALQQC